MRQRLIAFLYRLRAVVHRRRLDRDLDDELAFHLAMKRNELAQAGVPEPSRAAAVRFGSVSGRREEVRDMWTFPTIESLWADLRLATRRLRRERSFTLVAVCALALGISVNSTFLALVNAICLRGLPIAEADRVMIVASRDANDRSGGLSYPEFTDLRRSTTHLADVAAMALTPMTIGDTDRAPDRVLGAYISASAFTILRQSPAAGRAFLTQDDRPGAPAVGLIARGLWQSRYGGNAGIIGRTVSVNGTPVTIVGVMPEGFRFPGTADVWLPLAAMPGVSDQPRSARVLTVFGRLRDGTTQARVDAELATLRTAWTGDFPDAGRGVRTTLAPINEQFNPSVTDPAWLAFITAGFLVLLIACANVANLLLMRGVSRRREMAVRASIGGSRVRIVRQLLVEGGVLAAAATVVGVALSHAGLQILSTLLPQDALPYWMAFTLDYRIVALLALVSVACVIAFGLAPALHLSNVDPGLALSDTTRGGTRGKGARRWMAGFLATECALTLVLLAAVVMGARQDLASARREFRVDTTGVTTAWLTLPGASYRTGEARQAFHARLTERLGGLPSTSVSLATTLPGGGGAVQQLSIRGHAVPPGATGPTALHIAVDHRYFDVLRVPLRGRTFQETGGEGTAIVNERLAQLFPAGRDPIGEYVQVGTSPDSPWLQIIGIVPTIRQRGGLDPDPVVYVPLAAAGAATVAIAARSSADAGAVSAALRQAVYDIDPDLPVYRTMPLARAIADGRWSARLSTVMLRTIAAIGALLSLVGLYAVAGHTVGQRRRELALLAALGARPSQLHWQILRPALAQVAIGLVIGIGGTYAFEQLSASATSTVSMTDVATLAPLIAIVVIVAMVACVVPARRAARIDPIAALRGE